MNADIQYTHRIIQGGVNLSVTPVSNGVQVRYGDFTKFQGTGDMTKKSDVRFDITYTNIQQTLNNDNSITLTATANISNFVRTVVATDFNLNVHVTADISGHQFWNFVEPVINASNRAGYSRNISVTVPPLGLSWASSVHFLNDMETTDIDDEFDLGMRIYNPNPPDYRPGAHLINGTWQSHNRGAGKADIRRNNSWVTMRTQNGPDGTGNPPSIRRSDVWRNQSKIGQNAG